MNIKPIREYDVAGVAVLEITTEDADCLIEWVGRGEPLRERFVAKDECGGWCAIDNSTGDMWQEWFPKKEQALAYAAGQGMPGEYMPTAKIVRITAPRAVNPKAKRKAAEALFVMMPAERNGEIRKAKEAMENEDA